MTTVKGYLLLDAASSAVAANARIFATVDRQTNTQLIFIWWWDIQLSCSACHYNFFTGIHQLHNNAQWSWNTSKSETLILYKHSYCHSNICTLFQYQRCSQCPGHWVKYFISSNVIYWPNILYRPEQKIGKIKTHINCMYSRKRRNSNHKPLCQSG